MLVLNYSKYLINKFISILHLDYKKLKFYREDLEDVFFVKILLEIYIFFHQELNYGKKLY